MTSGLSIPHMDMIHNKADQTDIATNVIIGGCRLLDVKLIQMKLLEKEKKLSHLESILNLNLCIKFSWAKLIILVECAVLMHYLLFMTSACRVPINYA